MGAIRRLPIVDVLRALDVRFGSNRMIHCWHPEKHQHGDRTASVGIEKARNRVKCFGCHSKSMGPLDLVSDVLGVSPKEAALWIAARFEVPRIAPRRHIKEPSRLIHAAGFETALGLLIRSGLWSTDLSPVAQRLATVLLELANFRATAASGPRDQTKSLHLSYRAIARFAGSKAGRMSASAIVRAIDELEAIGWLKREGSRSCGPTRKVTCYTLTPFSEQVYDRANATVVELKADIATEKELRKEQRQRRIDAIPTAASNGSKEKDRRESTAVVTKYDYLSPKNSVEPNDASGEAA
jgi:hypothetical protein